MRDSALVTAPQEVLTFRKEFPILEHKVHLANNSRSALSRDGNIRAAFHYFNTPEDIEALIAALKDIEHLIVKAE